MFNGPPSSEYWCEPLKVQRRTNAGGDREPLRYPPRFARSRERHDYAAAAKNPQPRCPENERIAF